MLAARLHAPGEALRLVDVPRPEPSGSQVLVRVAGCGVCHTDLHIADGTQTRVELPLTLGHEVAGHIEAVGPSAAGALRRARLAVGDAVLVFGGWGCGSCRECVAGSEQRCERSRAPGFQVDGGYAEALLVPDPRHLVPLGSLDPVRAAPLADAGVTPYRAVRRAEPWLSDGARVLLIGCGALGQFALQYLRLIAPGGPSLAVAVRELDPGRLERASSLGADIGLLDGDGTMARDALGGPADVVFDFVGNDQTLRLGADVVAPDGLVMLIGEAGGHLSFGFDRPPVESWVTTVAWGSHAELSDVVRLARRGRIHWNVEPMPLRQVAEAHARLRRGDVDGRLVLVPG
ncbi:MAG TPA: alcohol dehydrogenase catalytic domain-containing protein [Candidatus Limnocylindria bacterium]|nr:alcohol dehydrogenase catalytic domain-containing protein [Candidatus Limnocylindria bacterium]